MKAQAGGGEARSDKNGRKTPSSKTAAILFGLRNVCIMQRALMNLRTLGGGH